MNMANLLLYSFLVIALFQICYFFSLWFGFHKKQQPPSSKKQLPVSVIICVKNEAETLKAQLPLICKQDYSAYEIVLINDSSSDNSLAVMKEFANTHKNIKVVNVAPNERFWGNKKYALTLGIKAASHELLLFTHADCQPASNQWLALMTQQLSTDKNIVIGYSGYYKKPFSFLNKLLRYDNLITAINYMGLSKLGLPYMGSGKNLAYSKSLFFEHSGFKNHMHLKSGDDYLFVNETADSEHTFVCDNPSAFTYSKSKISFKDWIFQKRRHMITTGHFKLKHKLLLGLFSLSQLLFFVLFIAIVITSSPPIWVFVVLALRYMVYIFSYGHSIQHLQDKQLIYLFPVLEIALISCQFYIFILNLIAKPNFWK